MTKKDSSQDDDKEKTADTSGENLNKLNRKIIFVDIDDEITEVYDRVKDLKVRDIYIVIPKRAALLHSVVNLKILKRKLEDIEKKLFIITNDKTGVQLALQADIAVYEKSEEDLGRKEAPDHPHLKISPIKALKNFLEEEQPVRMAQKKFSIFDIVKKKKNVAVSNEGLTNKAAKLKLNAPLLRSNKKETGRTVIFPTRIFSGYHGTVVILILASVILFLAVSYIALPGATIYLKPKSNVIEQNVNITLADAKIYAAELGTHPPNMIAAYAVSPNGPIRKNYTFNSTGKIFRGENAGGEIIIVNVSEKPWPLVKDTRFQSPEGIIFRLNNRLEVPAATKEGPAKLKAGVTADSVDINGIIVGDRGNIGPSRFFLPGLREASRKVLFAYSEGSMSSGKTLVTKIVSKEDINAAKEMAKQKIVSELVPSLNEFLSKMNQAQKSNLALLTEQKIEWKRAINYEEPKIYLDEKIIGKEMESFLATAEITARGIAYNNDEFVNILKRELKHRQLPQKRLTKIDENSISYRLHTAENGKFTVTATIKGIEEYELDPERENGQRLVNKIKGHILGWDRDEAEKFIQNLDEIDKVEIKTWPVWAPTIPNLANNIKVSIINN